MAALEETFVQFVRVNGITLHHQIIGGPAHRPVIVFINSLGTDYRIWRDVLVRLAGDYPLVAYDKRGHGLSVPLPIASTIMSMISSGFWST